MLPEQCDVAIVGAGNAAMCAALAAREHGASVVVLERAPEDEAGGNTAFPQVRSGLPTMASTICANSCPI